jgi:uncharacterized protein
MKFAEILTATTWKCNLKCSYCFVRENKIMNETDVMSTETGIRVIDALDEGLSDVKTIRVHLYGGEPFTNLAAAEAMVKRAKEKAANRFIFAVTTNGTILSDAVIDLLNAGKFEVILSIDGPEQVHDECRKTVNGAPTHHNVIRFLETVRARTKCRVTGAAVIRSGLRLLHISEYLRTLPIHEIKAQAVRMDSSNPFALTDKDIELYLKDLEAVGNHVIKELEEDKEPMDLRFSGRVMKLLVKGDEVSHYCDAGGTNLGITPSGSVLSCLLIDDPSAILGHINDDPQTWIQAGIKWQQKPMREKCKSCSYLQLCGGGCKAIVPVCGDDECRLSGKECEVAKIIYDHFKDNRESLLGLVGL